MFSGAPIRVLGFRVRSRVSGVALRVPVQILGPRVYASTASELLAFAFGFFYISVSCIEVSNMHNLFFRALFSLGSLRDGM